MNSLSFLLFSLLFFLPSCNKKENFTQPELGTRTVKILDTDGFQFKDLNKNGLLDKYEDWRLSPEERSKDLLSKMSVEEKAGFMLINSLNMVGTRGAEASEGKLSASDLSEGGGGGFGRGGGFGQNRPQNSENRERQGSGSGNRERTQNQEGGFIANMGRSGGTSTMVKEFHNRHFILRANESARITAEWANKLQELCEGESLGIPAIIASNPRNNITTNASLGTSVGTTVFTSWPGELGLSAMRDLPLVHEFADDSRQEWAAVGLRK
ncbi:MAG TPA: hypothetical protein VKA38_16285 [Draconibacterium sp.]|nr:hypothetical protein [Draconibacterium sp.]